MLTATLPRSTAYSVCATKHSKPTPSPSVLPAEASDNFLLDLYRMRAECFREAGQPDSCFVCLDSALAVIGRQPQQRKYQTIIALQRTGILLDAYPDSAAHYIRTTQAYLADSAMVTVRQLPRLFHVCGMALYHTPSRKAESIPYLEEAAAATSS